MNDLSRDFYPTPQYNSFYFTAHKSGLDNQISHSSDKFYWYSKQIEMFSAPWLFALLYTFLKKIQPFNIKYFQPQQTSVYEAKNAMILLKDGKI